MAEQPTEFSTTAAPVPDVTQQRINPLLSRVKLPGSTFKLPSGGFFYNNEELATDVKDSEVHVHPMTGIDEIVIKSPDKLFSGEAVKEVFTRCIPQIQKPMELLARDVDYLLICLRKVTFGDTVPLEAMHTCDGAKDHEYNISIDDFLRTSVSIDPTKMDRYTLTLDNGQKVSLRPIRFIDFISILQAADDDNDDPEKLTNEMYEQLANVITRVDDVTEREFIVEWLRTLSAGWLRDISTRIDELSEWGPTFQTTAVCKDCGEPFTITAPMNPIAFFT